jgi:hypothetical protein
MEFGIFNLMGSRDPVKPTAEVFSEVYEQSVQPSPITPFRGSLDISARVLALEAKRADRVRSSGGLAIGGAQAALGLVDCPPV